MPQGCKLSELHLSSRTEGLVSRVLNFDFKLQEKKHKHESFICLLGEKNELSGFTILDFCNCSTILHDAYGGCIHNTNYV